MTKSELPPLAEKRPVKRKRVLMGGVIVYEDGRRSFKCMIQDITPDVHPTGAKIKAANIPLLPKEVFLINISAGTVHPAHVVWANDAGAGLKLDPAFPVKNPPDRKLNYLKVIFSTHAPR